MTPIKSIPELSRQATPPLDSSLPNTTKAPCTLGVVSFLIGIAAVVVTLRSYVRAWILKRFGPDDYIMLVAMACSFGVLGCFVGESRHGLGRYNQNFFWLTSIAIAVNVATDVLFATLPIPMFYSVKVNKRTKASLMAILSLGYLACTAAIVKIVSQTQVLKLKDPYRDSTFTTWNSVELNIGILAGSLPTIKPLVRSLIETTRTITSGARSRPHTQHNNSEYIRQNSDIAMESLESRDHGSGGDKRLDLGFGATNSRKYDIEVSATNNSRDSDDRDSSLHILSSQGKNKSVEVLLEPPASAIMRTTEVYLPPSHSGGKGSGPALNEKKRSLPFPSRRGAIVHGPSHPSSFVNLGNHNRFTCRESIPLLSIPLKQIPAEERKKSL
ncbi:hypothetical protein VTN00DRAFT_6154 [Thermoascus crustaceus]|uniref:uncharacterized protein n=1 Tax=Thermoascus crustaceus TaxID=5088 RepID=UPI0037445282